MGDEQNRLKDLSALDFRWAREEDWKPAVTMIWKTFMEFEGKQYSKEGVKSFFEFITDDDIYRAFLIGTYQLLLAFDGDRIVGAASLRNRNRLSLLFVDESYQKQGIGRTLIELLCRYLQGEQGEREMIVKAAPYAVEFYKKIGFLVTGEEQEYSGIRVVPMERHLGEVS